MFTCLMLSNCSRISNYLDDKYKGHSDISKKMKVENNLFFTCLAVDIFIHLTLLIVGTLSVMGLIGMSSSAAWGILGTGIALSLLHFASLLGNCITCLKRFSE